MDNVLKSMSNRALLRDYRIMKEEVAGVKEVKAQGSRYYLGGRIDTVLFEYSSDLKEIGEELILRGYKLDKIK